MWWFFSISASSGFWVCCGVFYLIGFMMKFMFKAMYYFCLFGVKFFYYMLKIIYYMVCFTLKTMVITLQLVSGTVRSYK